MNEKCSQYCVNIFFIYKFVHNVRTELTDSTASSLYAIKVLRAHGLSDTALQEVYKSVVVWKLLYAASAWWGFASVADRRWVEAVLRRSKRSGLYSSRQTASEIINSADYKLFDQVIRGNHHVLHQLLTDRVDISYNLRSQAHSRALPEKKGHLADKSEWAVA